MFLYTLHQQFEVIEIKLLHEAHKARHGNISKIGCPCLTLKFGPLFHSEIYIGGFLYIYIYYIYIYIIYIYV